uniref:Flavodoxin-like domain-containing protein n=1 Tax=Phaeocystis antarctica TaxID=33657 RepID=A0A6T7TZC0_9EUKA|mmetsp:Transcript_5445/g.12619  ORF Transcript_5445/g.12619 Transcript_5445/m.12619 type:complete len:205 (+) Transcript_5445:303-917(+)
MLFAAQSMMFQAAAGLVAAPLAARSVERVAAPAMAVGLVYSTTTGNTETVAGYIAEETGLSAVDIADLTGEAVAAFDGIIVGAPTWHTGADTERSGTAWDEFIYGDLAGLDLKGKKVAIFGLGDQGGYGDNFCDAMDELMTCFKGSGADIVGSWSTDGYDHMESKSVDGAKFVGLACDEDNQPEMSEDRVKAWIAQIKGEGMPL